MTSPCRNLAVLLLFLVASPLLHSYPSAHAASTSRPVTRQRIIFMTSDDDYEDPDDHSPSPDVLYTKKTTILHRLTELCHYNLCLENQEPCTQLAARSGCLCPGVSGADTPPFAPRIQALLQVSEGSDRGKVEVQWCAPPSVVSRYRVVIERSEGDALDFGEEKRRGVVGSLEVGTKVCVEAVNNAGHSTPTEFSCKRYETPNTSEHNLFAGVIGGGVALLVLLIIAGVIVWQYQKHKKAKRDSADGLGNPSYSTEGTL